MKKMTFAGKELLKQNALKIMNPIGGLIAKAVQKLITNF